MNLIPRTGFLYNPGFGVVSIGRLCFFVCPFLSTVQTHKQMQSVNNSGYSRVCVCIHMCVNMCGRDRAELCHERVKKKSLVNILIYCMLSTECYTRYTRGKSVCRLSEYLRHQI